MARIDVYTNEMSSLSARLKKISSVIENAEQVTGKVQSNLDFQVAAKADIAGALSKTRKQLRQQKDKIVKMANLTTTSAAEFQNADGQMDKSARSILGKISAPVTGLVHGIKQLFVGAAISRYKAINSIFMPTAAVITIGGLGELIRRLAQIINGWKQNTGATTVPTSSSGSETNPGGATPSVDVPKPEVVNTANENLKPYQGNDKYSGYNMVNSFDAKYLLAQRSYDIYNSKGKNVGCMACGVAMMQYMKTGKYLDPKNPKVWDDKNKQTLHNYIQSVPNSSKRTVDDQLKILYSKVNEGNPVMICLSKSNNLKSTHNVVVVGIRQGADINNLKKSDFLVADPNGGVVRTIEEAETKCGKIMRNGDNYGMWVANNNGY